MTTIRALREDVQNSLDFLLEAELLQFANAVVTVGNRVSWRPRNPGVPFLSSRNHPDVDQYISWVANGAYSAVMFDGSLLQITYEVDDGEVSGHRLAFIPCPYDIDRTFLDEGWPLADVLDLYLGSETVLRSPIRFDYEPKTAGGDHPAVHLSLNAAECRIECAAPLHVLRFVDFVFRHFYPELWRAHDGFFEAAAWRHVGIATPSLNRHRIHLAWDVNATQTSVSGV